MLIDSSQGARVPALVAQRSELFTFNTSSPRLLNRPIRGAPGPREAVSMPTAGGVRALRPHRYGVLSPGMFRADAGDSWAFRAGWGQPTTGPGSSYPGLLGRAWACLGGRSPWVPAPLVADVWEGGRRPTPRWPGFGRDCFLEPVLPTAANSSR